MASPPPKVAVDSWFGCWLWLGSRNSNGYGTEWVGSRPRLAHIAAWERHHGVKRVADDRVLDHLCRRRHCVRPEHLELITQSENNRRRSWAHRSKRERCIAGHSLLEHGRRTPEAGVVCRLCSEVWRPDSEEASPKT